MKHILSVCISQCEAAGFEGGDYESYWLVECESMSMGIVTLILKIEAALSFEASVSLYQTTRCQSKRG